MAQPETNYTHENENWRQRLRKEHYTAKVHDGVYDYLIWKKIQPCVDRPSATATVKYFSGGDWTVAQKRIQLHESSTTYQTEDGPYADDVTHKDALVAAQSAHRLVSARNKQTSCQHRTTSNTAYGARALGLEMFGLGEHGRLATRTKVENGTKQYHV